MSAAPLSIGGAAAPAGRPVDPAKDDVTLLIEGRSFGGWQDVELTRGIEIMPSHFTFAATERFPSGGLDIAPGAEVIVMLGADVAMTGYVDRYEATIKPGQHQVRIMGRGKCADLVDCSGGILPGSTALGTIRDQTAFQIANRLCDPFGIHVVEEEGQENALIIAAFNIPYGETAYDVIDGIARYHGVIPYENANGDLVLSAVGTKAMASGFAAPGNVEAASVTLSADQRYSDYLVTWTTTAPLTGQQATGGQPMVLNAYVKDRSKPPQRFRPRAIVSEQTSPEVDIAKLRAAWELNRRNGRSQAVSLTCDSWRDGAGALWEPNRLAVVDIPSCKIVRQTWLISQVTYRRGEDGTHADVVLMPPDAFLPMPSLLSGVSAQIASDAGLKGGAAAPAAKP